MAWGNQGLNHYVYGAGTWSRYYWNPSYNPNATFDNCMANCTTFAYGRVRENGFTAPVTRIRNANNWHTVVNTSGGWTLLNYTSGMSLRAGDIVQWGDYQKYMAGESPQYRYSAVHVAVVETYGTNPGVSGSWYTGDDETADSDRSTAVMGNTLADVCNWMVAHVSGRFYHYNNLSDESSLAGHGYPPMYVLRYTGSGPTPPEPGGDEPDVTVSPSSASGTISASDTHIDFNFTITVTGIPEGEDASDAISFSPNCYRYAYTTGWQYTEYESEGVTYRQGVRSLIVRYDRLHDYSYTDTAYMYYIKTFSNGSVNSSTRMNISIEAGEDPDIVIMNFIINKKKRKFHVEII